MISVQGYAAYQAQSPLAPYSFQRREVGPKEILIDIHYCGICHSDIHQVRDEWGGAVFPMVPGHEIAGIITQIGSQVSKFKVGDRVGVGCMVESCRECRSCKEGEEQYCEKGPHFTYNSVEKDGKTPTQGGYSTAIVVNEDFALRIPSHLPLEGAAPLLCAGITTFSPLKHWKAGAGKKVAVVGLGGLGHMAVKFAKAMGADVTVLSQSNKKRDDAKRLGADSFFATAEPETFQKLNNFFDLIVNTVSARLDWNQYLNLLVRDGTLILLGVPPEAPEVHAFSLIGKRRSLAGSLIGGIRETQEMLDFCGEHNIVSDIEVIPISQVNEAFERVMRGDVKYRFVIDLQSLK